jgi:uncharacterized protein (TIGR03435 family)
MRKIVLSIFVLVFAAASAFAQPAKAPLSFDVASVKAAGPLDPQKIVSGEQRLGMKQDAGRVDIESMSLAELLYLAFKFPPDRVKGPDFLNVANTMSAERFSIHAKLPAGAKPDDVPEMLQTLLADRFKLAYHRETKEQPVFALIIGKTGSKLQPSAPDPAPSPDAPAAGGSNRPDAVSISGNPQTGLTVKGSGSAGATKITMGQDGQMHLEAEKLSLQQLADSLARFVGRPVVDMTGLTGTYKIGLDLSREDMMAAARAAGVNIPAGALGGAPGAGPADPGGTAIFQSVENMGLKLDSRKLAVDYMVIDRLEKTPTED